MLMRNNVMCMVAIWRRQPFDKLDETNVTCTGKKVVNTTALGGTQYDPSLTWNKQKPNQGCNNPWKTVYVPLLDTLARISAVPEHRVGVLFLIFTTLIFPLTRCPVLLSTPSSRPTSPRLCALF